MEAEEEQQWKTTPMTQSTEDYGFNERARPAWRCKLVEFVCDARSRQCNRSEWSRVGLSRSELRRGGVLRIKIVQVASQRLPVHLTDVNESRTSYQQSFPPR